MEVKRKVENALIVIVKKIGKMECAIQIIEKFRGFSVEIVVSVFRITNISNIKQTVITNYAS